MWHKKGEFQVTLGACFRTSKSPIYLRSWGQGKLGNTYFLNPLRRILKTKLDESIKFAKQTRLDCSDFNWNRGHLWVNYTAIVILGFGCSVSLLGIESWIIACNNFLFPTWFNEFLYWISIVSTASNVPFWYPYFLLRFPLCLYTIIFIYMDLLIYLIFRQVAPVLSLKPLPTSASASQTSVCIPLFLLLWAEKNWVIIIEK